MDYGGHDSAFFDNLVMVLYVVWFVFRCPFAVCASCCSEPCVGSLLWTSFAHGLGLYLRLARPYDGSNCINVASFEKNDGDAYYNNTCVYVAVALSSGICTAAS